MGEILITTHTLHISCGLTAAYLLWANLIINNAIYIILDLFMHIYSR